MKKVCICYRAFIDKELEISDELYESIKNDMFSWQSLEELFEKAPIEKIWLSDLQCVENVRTGECIYED